MKESKSATEIPDPCPKCGSVRYVVKSHYDVWLSCKICNYQGPHAEKLADAISKWNKVNRGEEGR